ncbi:MAG: DNA polymerase IV [Chlorobi bacterium]|nr:DNA polymerase IV [Chlorobiota bacterium]
MIQNNRSIVHMDLDTFFVSCERLLDSRLNGKPVLIGGISDRGVVASCSYEARTFGIHSAMPMRMARELCPEAVIIRGNTGIYTKFSRMVTDIIKENVPVFEKSSIDEFYIDLTGMDKFFGNHKLASEIRKKIIKETGLPISFGLSNNKTVSKIATGEAKPNNQIKIDYGNEKKFLSPLSIRKIPMVGNKTYQILRNLGVKQIKTIQQSPVELMEKVLGKNGKIIWKKANGIDNTPVIPYSEKKSISTERTFERDTIDIGKLKRILISMVENLAYQLRKKEKVAATITVKIRYSDFNTYTLQRKIPYTSADHILIPVVAELFKRLYNRRLLVRLIGVRFSNIVHGAYQINLFEDTAQFIHLYRAIDKMRNRYGSKAVIRAVGIDVKYLKQSESFNALSADKLITIN